MRDHPADRRRHTASFEIINRLGLHARAAAQLAETARRFAADVHVTKDGQTVNAKSIIDLMLLAAARGSRIEVSAVGADAAAAIAAIEQLIAGRFGEPD